MTEQEKLKQIVKDKYGEIASKANTPQAASCCGQSSAPTSINLCCGSKDDINYSNIGEDYSTQQGYVPEADLGLGCGIPTQFAGLEPGQTVIDLGSGAGNDVFVARSFVGDSGKVIGVDMTPEMLEKANKNKAKLGYNNVEFYLGDIENLPLENSIADVVISNCVLNLVPDKQKAFAEIYRVLKPGGHFCVSDMVIKGELPEGIRKSAEFYAGCVAGALSQDNYIDIINETKFEKVEIKKSKKVSLDDQTLLKFVSQQDLDKYRGTDAGVYSITVIGYK